MSKNDKFYFSGVPESIRVEPVGEGFRVIIGCKNIKFNLENLKGTIDNAPIYFFTSKEDVARNLNRELSIEGIISAPDLNGNRNLISLKLK